MDTADIVVEEHRLFEADKVVVVAVVEAEEVAAVLADTVAVPASPGVDGPAL